MASRVTILLFIALASPAFGVGSGEGSGEGFGEGRNLSDCADNFKTLEWALLHTKNNTVELRKAFYPPRGEPSDFVTVHYKFLNEDGTNTTCKKTWFWTTVGIYLIQPPSIYQFMSLFFFNVPRGNKVNLFLPNKCRDLVTWENGSCSCDSDGMLDIISQQLKLYAQFNNPDHIKIDDTLTPLAVCNDKLEEKYDTGKIMTFFIFGIIGPFLYIFIMVPLIRSVKEPLRNAIRKQENHANLAAVALTGVVFTTVVLLMDVYAMVLVWEGKHEFIQHRSIPKEKSLLFVNLTVFIDALPILYSGIALIYLRFLLCTRNLKVLQTWYGACFYPTLGLGDPVYTQGALCDRKEEFKLGIVVSLCFAPFFCIASHSGYIVVGWVSTHSEHSASYAYLYIFSFAYYFFLFRQLYTAFVKYETTYCCHELLLLVTLFKEFFIWLSLACKCFFCLFYHARDTECTTNCLGNRQATEEHRQQRNASREQVTDRQQYIKIEGVDEDREDRELQNVIGGQEDHEDRKDQHPKDSFNLHAFFIAFWIGFLLVSVEAVVVAGFILIPITLDAAPTNFYHYAQLAFVIVTGLITYKFFQAGIGPKKILQAFLRKFRALKEKTAAAGNLAAGSAGNLQNLEDNEALGRVIGELAHTIINILPDTLGHDHLHEGNGHQQVTHNH